MQKIQFIPESHMNLDELRLKVTNKVTIWVHFATALLVVPALVSWYSLIPLFVLLYTCRLVRILNEGSQRSFNKLKEINEVLKENDRLRRTQGESNETRETL